MRKFNAGGKIVKATHLWKTNPVARGARRFTFIYRLCNLVECKDQEAIIKLSGTCRKKTVKANALIDIDTINPKHYQLSL